MFFSHLSVLMMDYDQQGADDEMAMRQCMEAPGGTRHLQENV